MSIDLQAFQTDLGELFNKHGIDFCAVLYRDGTDLVLQGCITTDADQVGMYVLRDELDAIKPKVKEAISKAGQK